MTIPSIESKSSDRRAWTAPLGPGLLQVWLDGTPFAFVTIIVMRPRFTLNPLQRQTIASCSDLTVYKDEVNYIGGFGIHVRGIVCLLRS